MNLHREDLALKARKVLSSCKTEEQLVQGIRFVKLTILEATNIRMVDFSTRRLLWLSCQHKIQQRDFEFIYALLQDVINHKKRLDNRK